MHFAQAGTRYFYRISKIPESVLLPMPYGYGTDHLFVLFCAGMFKTKLNSGKQGKKVRTLSAGINFSRHTYHAKSIQNGIRRMYTV